jgi:hypothetical protein
MDSPNIECPQLLILAKARSFAWSRFSRSKLPLLLTPLTYIHVGKASFELRYLLYRESKAGFGRFGDQAAQAGYRPRTEHLLIGRLIHAEQTRRQLRFTGGSSA